MSETRAVKDLAIGDVIQVDGFDGNVVVKAARKIKKGLDTGKFQVTLATPDGETEVMAFSPDEEVKVVGRRTEATGKSKGGRKDQGAGKGKGQAKGKGKTKAKPDADGEASPAMPTPELQAAQAPESNAESKPETAKADRMKKAEGGEKKLSAIDAAAKVLQESSQAMNCQELINTMAEKGLWTSQKGRTPAGTLYSAMLREIQAKGSEARFRKTERGKFGAANSK